MVALPVPPGWYPVLVFGDGGGVGDSTPVIGWRRIKWRYIAAAIVGAALFATSIALQLRDRGKDTDIFEEPRDGWECQSISRAVIDTDGLHDTLDAFGAVDPAMGTLVGQGFIRLALDVSDFEEGAYVGLFTPFFDQEARVFPIRECRGVADAGTELFLGRYLAANPPPPGIGIPGTTVLLDNMVARCLALVDGDPVAFDCEQWEGEGDVNEFKRIARTATQPQFSPTAEFSLTLMTMAVYNATDHIVNTSEAAAALVEAYVAANFGEVINTEICNLLSTFDVSPYFCERRARLPFITAVAVAYSNTEMLLTLAFLVATCAVARRRKSSKKLSLFVGPKPPKGKADAEAPPAPPSQAKPQAVVLPAAAAAAGPDPSEVQRSFAELSRRHDQLLEEQAAAARALAKLAAEVEDLKGRVGRQPGTGVRRARGVPRWTSEVQGARRATTSLWEPSVGSL